MELQKCPHGHDARVAAVESKSGQWTAYAYCDRRDCHWMSAPYYADAEEAAKEKAARVWNAVMGAYHERDEAPVEAKRLREGIQRIAEDMLETISLSDANGNDTDEFYYMNAHDALRALLATPDADGKEGR